FDIKRRKLELVLPEAEIKARRERFKPSKPRVKKGYLALYLRIVSSAAEGAILK
ncbi:unnamed protein product, partial [marine sediment metagenome]